MIMKVKEPIERRVAAHAPGPADLHLLPLRGRREAHAGASSTAARSCVAYETVELPTRELPLLTPMSEVAGRMAVQEGAKYLEKLYGGRGVLLGGVPGVAPAKVVILGGGIVGINAAKMAAGLGAKVTILDLSLERLRYLSRRDAGERAILIHSNRHNILEQIATADLVVGGVLIPGAKAPKLVRREDLKPMQPGSVIVDVAIDQGGCVETIHADDAREPDLRRRRHHPLRRGEHAGRRAADLHARAHQRDAAVRAAAGEQGLEAGAAGQPGAAQGPEHDRGQGHLPGVAEAFGMKYADRRSSSVASRGVSEVVIDG